MNPVEFCRELETYLCRKNDGHLIRIVGPVFEQVCGWAVQGVPIKIAQRGIDRYFDRQRSASRPPMGARRRPVRIEFCEADILDAFDEWRRAVGLSASALARDAASASAMSATSSAEHDAAADTRSASADSRAAGSPPEDEAPGFESASAIPARGANQDEGSGEGSRASRGMRERDADPHVAVGDGADRVDRGASVEAGLLAERTASPSNIGVSSSSSGRDADAGEGDGAAARRRAPLLTHIDRAMARLTQRRVDSAIGPALGETIDGVLRDLDTMRASARGARGDARHALIERLAAVDRTLIEAARAAIGSTTMWDELRAEAGHELEPFRTRLSPEALRAATEAALDRLVRERWRLPSVRLDE